MITDTDINSLLTCTYNTVSIFMYIKVLMMKMVRHTTRCTSSRGMLFQLGCGRAQAFAMTENSHQVSSNPLPHHGARKAGSVGKAQGSVEARAHSLKSWALMAFECR